MVSKKKQSSQGEYSVLQLSLTQVSGEHCTEEKLIQDIGLRKIMRGFQSMSITAGPAQLLFGIHLQKLCEKKARAKRDSGK